MNKWKIYVMTQGELGDGIELKDAISIRFIYDDNRNTIIDIDPRERNECLEVFGQRSLQIFPEASNHIHIKSAY